MSKFLKFPENFMWGGASAAEQTEGHGNTGKGLTVWDKFFKDEPKSFWNGVGPDLTDDFTNHYDSDFDLFNSFNAKSIRLGVSWARVMPDGVNVSEEGLQFYRDLFASAKSKGVTVILNLFHFDMPLWANELGDWRSREVIDKFLVYTDLVMKEFADKVDFIATFNEPGVPVMHGYQGVNHLPRIKDNKKAFQCGFGILLAHAKVVKLFREKYEGRKAKIGVVINVAPAIVKDGNLANATETDKNAAFMHNLLHNDFYLYPMVKGEWPKGGIEFAKERGVVPEHTQEDLDIIAACKVDFLGTNFYAPERVMEAAPGKQIDCFFDEIDHFKWDKARYNVFRGWEIRPESLYDIAKIIMTEFDNIPFFISENGMGVENEGNFRDESGVIQDNYRIAFLQEHLEQLHRAMEEGANCFGYHMWAMMDNWSWRNAYKNTYGFVEIDLKDQSRHLKKSAYWYKDMIDAGGFETGYPKIEETIDLAKAKYSESVN